MYPTPTTILFLITSATAFPFVAHLPGVDSSQLHHTPRTKAKRQASCPFNSNHPGAAPYTDEYPYTGAKNGLAGTGVGGILVPAAGDTAHAFEAPGADDIRGPCPGLNTAANHHVSLILRPCFAMWLTRETFIWISHVYPFTNQGVHSQSIADFLTYPSS